MLLQSVGRIPVCPITRELVMEAVEVRQRYRISYRDAAIITAAKQKGCHILYIEYLNSRQVYDVRLVGAM